MWRNRDCLERSASPSTVTRAMGSASQEEVDSGWTNSPGHCLDIMRADSTEIGVGFDDSNPSYRYLWTQEFVARYGGWK